MGRMAVRLNVPMSAADRARIEARAAAAGLSASEFVRRAAEAYDAAGEAEVRTLLAEVGAAVTRMEARLEAGLVALAELEAERAALRAAAVAEGRALAQEGGAPALGLG